MATAAMSMTQDQPMHQIGQEPEVMANRVYQGTSLIANRVIIPNFMRNQDKKACETASVLIPYTTSLALTASLYKSSSFSWVQDLSLTGVADAAYRLTVSYGSQIGSSVVKLGEAIGRAALAKSRDSNVDVISLVVPTALCIGTDALLTKKVAKWMGVKESTVKMTLPGVVAWALTPIMCSLLGRKPASYPFRLVILGMISGLGNELIKR